MNIQPVNKNLLVVPAEAEDSTKSGIILPADAQEKPKYGIVTAVAPDCVGFLGDFDPKVFGSSYKGLPELIGAKVLYRAYSGSNIKIDGKEYLLLPEDEVLAFLTEETEDV